MKSSLISAGRSFEKIIRGIRDIEMKITFPDLTKHRDTKDQEVARKRKRIQDVRFYELP